VEWDLRKAEPYSVYGRFDFDVPLGTVGDCWDRNWVRLEEMRQSIKIIAQALEMLPEGPVQTPGVPRLLQPPPGEVYTHIESPRGELGFYIVSDGSIHPYRLKIRSPAFSNLSVLPLLAQSTQIADLVVIIGSLDPVFGEVDR
jgi:NADH-quinone oxidoreductase subunit D